MIQVWLLDENGFFTGESIFVEELDENMTTDPLLVGYVKAKWVDGKWAEGATDEEIKAWEEVNKIDISSEPTTEERITKLEEEKSILAENVYQLASILEIMLGGIEDGQTEATTTDTAN